MPCSYFAEKSFDVFSQVKTYKYSFIFFYLIVVELSGTFYNHAREKNYLF